MLLAPLAIGFMLLTLIVLIGGITLMARGGKLNEKYANKLMMARVTLQALAVVLLAYLFVVKG